MTLYQTDNFGETFTTVGQFVQHFYLHYTQVSELPIEGVSFFMVLVSGAVTNLKSGSGINLDYLP